MRVESRGVELQRRWRAKRIAWGLLAVFVALITVTVLDLGSFAYPQMPWLYLASFVGALWGATRLLRMRFYAPLTAPTAARSPATVMVEEDELVVDRRGATERWKRSDIVEGWTEAFHAEDDVVLRLRSDDLIAIHVDTPAAAAQLLCAAGVSVAEQTVRIRLAEASASSTLVGGIAGLAGIVLPFTLVGTGTGMAFELWNVVQGGSPSGGLWWCTGIFAAAVFASYKVLQAMTPPLATVGVDGLEVRGLGRRTFIPFDRVAGVAAVDRGVLLEMKDGPDLTLTTWRNGLDGGQSHAVMRTALLRRIEQALAVRSATGSQVARAAVLGRQGRPFARWREELVALAKQDGSYRRAAGLGRDDLQRILDDASAAPEQRIGAAVALTAAGVDEETHRRVRVAAAACAHADVRAALEAAAEGELEEEQLERLAVRAE